MRAIILTLLLCIPVFAVDPPKVPKEVTGTEGQLMTLAADCPGAVKFRVIEGTGLIVIPQDKLKNPKELLFYGKPGRYRIASWTSDNEGPSDMADTLIVITKNGESPDDPPLLKSLRAVYKADDKDAVSRLSTSYKDTATSLDNGKPLTNEDVLRTAASKRNAAGVGDSAIPAIRNLCNAEIGKLLGNDPAGTVSDAQRSLVIKQFRTMADCLDQLVK